MDHSNSHCNVHLLPKAANDTRLVGSCVGVSPKGLDGDVVTPNPSLRNSSPDRLQGGEYLINFGPDGHADKKPFRLGGGVLMDLALQELSDSSFA